MRVSHAASRIKILKQVIGASGQGLTAQFLPDKPEELFKRLEVLIAAGKKGHTNVNNE